MPAKGWVERLAGGGIQKTLTYFYSKRCPFCIQFWKDWQDIGDRLKDTCQCEAVDIDEKPGMWEKQAKKVKPGERLTVPRLVLKKNRVELLYDQPRSRSAIIAFAKS